MHQHQLVNFACKFGMVPVSKRSDEESFTAEGYTNEWAVYSFLSKKGRRALTPTQLMHLQRHYKTIFAVDGVFDDRKLVEMDKYIQIWHRCRVGREEFHCREYEQPKATRLNHLACITEWIDLNARVSYQKRPEKMASQPEYVYIQFYGVHQFEGRARMVMYSEYRKVEIHNGLVEDMGSRFYGFQDVQVLDHLCARVPGAGNKIYFVDDRITMEGRLRHALRAR